MNSEVLITGEGFFETGIVSVRFKEKPGGEDREEVVAGTCVSELVRSFNEETEEEEETEVVSIVCVSPRFGGDLFPIDTRVAVALNGKDFGTLAGRCHIDFPDYTPEELLHIARLMLEEQQYRMTAEGEGVLLEYLDKRMQLPLFANARTVTNAIDAARMHHANRMFNSGDRILTKSDLVTIEADDIRESSLFSEVV